MLDKAKSYKFVGGKFVEHTAEELVRLEQLKAEHAERERKPTKVPREKEWFVKVTLSQAERLVRLEHVCWPLFTILLFENFRQRGRPFILPARQLGATVRGLSRKTLYRALAQLEMSGLISVKRNPPQRPLITVSTGSPMIQ